MKESHYRIQFSALNIGMTTGMRLPSKCFWETTFTTQPRVKRKMGKETCVFFPLWIFYFGEINV